MKVKSQKQRCWKWDETLWMLKLRKMSTTIRVKEWYKHLKKETRFLFRKKWHLGQLGKDDLIHMKQLLLLVGVISM